MQVSDITQENRFPTPSEGVEYDPILPTPSEGVKSAYRRYRHCSDVLHVLHPKTPSEGVDIQPFSRLLWKEWNCRGASTNAVVLFCLCRHLLLLRKESEFKVVQ